MSHLTRQLEALSSCGCVLSSEVQAAMSTSLVLKQVELAAEFVHFWGKFSTAGEKDYLIAFAFKGAKMIPGAGPKMNAKYYYSLDGVSWLDIEDIKEEQIQYAEKLDSMLTGDPAHKYTVYEPQEAPEPPAELAEGEEPPPPPEPLEFPVSELEYISYMIKSINGIWTAPKGIGAVSAEGNLIKNPAYSGLSYPDKLESYSLLGSAKTLDQAVPGTWSIMYDSLKSLAILRSLEYPGYFAFNYNALPYSGALYFGTGLKNKDLAFCI